MEHNLYDNDTDDYYDADRDTLTLKGPGIFTVFHVGADLKLQIGM